MVDTYKTLMLQITGGCYPFGPNPASSRFFLVNLTKGLVIRGTHSPGRNGARTPAGETVYSQTVCRITRVLLKHRFLDDSNTGGLTFHTATLGRQRACSL